MQLETFEALRQQLNQKIAAKSLVLPMLPQVTTNVLSLVNDIDSDASSLAKLIQSDQALAGHVMRIANSAAYSPTAKMTSLQQATARLGMQNIAEIAMAATLGPKLFVVPGFESMVNDLWLRSLFIAVWSKEIARKARKNVESTFLCGLLFQIGRPAVLQAVLECAHGSSLEVDKDTVQALIDEYQLPVGVMLAEQWQLPAAVGHTITGVDSSAPAVGSQDVITAVRAARVFAEVGMSGGEYEPATLSSDSYVMAMNLYASDVEQLLEHTDAIHQTIEALKL